MRPESRKWSTLKAKKLSIEIRWVGNRRNPTPFPAISRYSPSSPALHISARKGPADKPRLVTQGAAEKKEENGCDQKLGEWKSRHSKSRGLTQTTPKQFAKSRTHTCIWYLHVVCHFELLGGEGVKCGALSECGEEGMILLPEHQSLRRTNENRV